nr:hypothetical protein P5648_18225 [Bacillus subtilis]
MSPDLYQWRHSALLWATEVVCLRCWSSLAGREDGLNAHLSDIYIGRIVGLVTPIFWRDENRRD